MYNITKDQYYSTLMQDPDLPGTYVRALRVLAICPLNRSLILEAGALDPLADLLCSLPLEELEAVLFTLSLLSKVEDARLNTFPPPALDRLLYLLKSEDAGPELRATSASTLSRLSHSFQNRSWIVHHARRYRFLLDYEDCHSWLRGKTQFAIVDKYSDENLGKRD